MRSALFGDFMHCKMVAFLPTFRDSISVKPSRVKQWKFQRLDCLNLEDGIDLLPRILGKKATILLSIKFEKRADLFSRESFLWVATCSAQSDRRTDITRLVISSLYCECP